jgi:hypothetical protein
MIPTLFAPGWDGWHSTGPMAVLTDEAIRGGEIALWNPLSFTGAPFAAHPEVAMFYPPNLIRGLLVTSDTAYASHLSIVFLSFFHLVLGGVGAFLLARAHKISIVGSAVVVLIFVLNGSFLRWALELWHNGVCIAWMPFLMLLMKRSIDSDRWRNTLSMSLVMGLILGAGITAGFPQFFIHLCVALFAYGVVYAFQVRGESERDLAKRTVMMPLTIPFVAAPILAAIFLLPAFEYFSFIGRATVQHSGDNPIFIDRNPISIVKHFVVFAGSSNLEGRRLAGACALILCCISFFSTENRKSWWLWFAMGIVMLDFCIGRPFPVATIIDTLTQSHMRLPSRLTAFLCLPLGMLAGLGADSLLASTWTRQRKLAASAAITGVAILCTGLVALWFHEESWLTASRLVLVTPIAIGGLMVVAQWRGRSIVWCGAVIGVLLIELVTWNRAFLGHLYSRVHLDELGYSAEVLQAKLNFTTDNYREAEPFPNAHVNFLRPTMTGFDPLYIELVRQTLCAPEQENEYSHWVKDWEITETNQRGNLFAKRSVWLSRYYVRGELPSKDQLFPIATTSYLPDPPTLTVPEILAGEIPKNSVSPESSVQALMIIYETESGDPDRKYRLRPDAPVSKDRHSTLLLTVEGEGNGTVTTRFLGTAPEHRSGGYAYALRPSSEPYTLDIPLPGFDVKEIEITFSFASHVQNVVVSGAEIHIDQQDDNDRIDIVSRSANQMTVDVGPLDGPRILTYVDAFYPGWKAFIDDVPTQLFKSLDVYKAVEVPAGRHRVQFVYDPASYRHGKWITFIALGTVFSALVLVRLKRDGAQEPSDVSRN